MIDDLPLGVSCISHVFIIPVLHLFPSVHPQSGPLHILAVIDLLLQIVYLSIPLLSLVSPYLGGIIQISIRLAPCHIKYRSYPHDYKDLDFQKS